MKRTVDLRQRTMTVEEIHTHAQLHMKKNFKHLSEQRQAVVKYVVGKMKKYNGAFFEGYKTIAAALELSVSTVRRAIEVAKKLGIFVIENCYESTVNGKNRQTTNNILLAPCTEKEPAVGDVVAVPVEQELLQHQVQNENLYNAKEVNENDQLHTLYKEYVKQGINKETFSKVVKETKNKRSYKSLVAYVRGCLNNIVNRRENEEYSSSVTYDEHLNTLMQSLGINKH